MFAVDRLKFSPLYIGNTTFSDMIARMPTQTEAVKAFLIASTHSDLAEMYHAGMEVQVNVAMDDGERVDTEHNGRKSYYYSDGLARWKPFRIPYNAKTKPEYDEKELTFSLEQHADAIGMTGWDWKRRVSRWVAYDFDAITGHSDKHQNKHTNDELNKIRDAAMGIPWVTIRRSTSGRGLHFYVFLNDVATETHTEHAALGRAILGMLSVLTGFDFQSRVDTCGGNMWVWARKMRGTNGLSLIKQGDMLEEIPPNWRDHIKVVTGSRKKNLPQQIEEHGTTTFFDELAGQRQRIPLDDQHHLLLNFLRENGTNWWWDPDHHMLSAHSVWLKKAHEALSLKGIFKTSSPGTDLSTNNCFLFPMKRGMWSVRRYSLGIQEHESWTQDGQGWTQCYLNREPDFRSACRTFGGKENKKGDFVFEEFAVAAQAANVLGAQVIIPQGYDKHQTTLTQHKDGRIVVEIRRDPNRDTPIDGWLTEAKTYQKIFNVPQNTVMENETASFDEDVRHLITEDEKDAGWCLKRESGWGIEPLPHVKMALKSLGHNPKDIDTGTGTLIRNPWKLVNMPFQPEYPGDRKWNRDSAQLRFTPNFEKTDYAYKTWTKILNHCGKGLDDAISINLWCKKNNILKGGDYLRLWIASMLQYPAQPLPYLFFFGDQNSGKSVFHETIGAILLTQGYFKADQALTNPSNFNGELEGVVLCAVEEINLTKNLLALNRIKDWVTSPKMVIHRKGETPYHTTNTSHWIQCANKADFCPVFPGDTRITMCHVPAIDIMDMIPKKILFPMLENEAQDFISDLLQIELPESPDRLNIPVITTQHKSSLEQSNESAPETFFGDYCENVPGAMLLYSSVFKKFQETADPSQLVYWTQQKFGKELPYWAVKGRAADSGQWFIGNMWWKGEQAPNIRKGRYTLGGSKNDTLVLIDA